MQSFPGRLLKGPVKCLPTSTEFNPALADLWVNAGIQDSVYTAQSSPYLSTNITKLNITTFKFLKWNNCWLNVFSLLSFQEDVPGNDILVDL